MPLPLEQLRAETASHPYPLLFATISGAHLYGFPLPYIPDLIARKLAGPEQATLDDADIAFYQAEFAQLWAELETAQQQSVLPDVPRGRAALNDLLVRLRLRYRR